MTEVYLEGTCPKCGAEPGKVCTGGASGRTFPLGHSERHKASTVQATADGLAALGEHLKEEEQGTGDCEPAKAIRGEPSMVKSHSHVTRTGHVLTPGFPEPRCPFCRAPLTRFQNICADCAKGAPHLRRIQGT